MTIHTGDPFADPVPDPVRRFRGRLGGAVTLWTSPGAGLTVSSVMVANGEPGHLLALLDAESGLFAALVATRRCAVSLLEWEHRDLADAFAGTAPAPGGPFRTWAFTDTEWGPVPQGAGGWAGAELAGDPTEVGWSMLVDCTIEHVELAGSVAPLVHRRGRYQPPPAAG